jgi:c-di-GMP-related signal transduction protein
MPVLVQQLELNRDIADALTTRSGYFGSALALVESYEAGAWPAVLQQCTQIGVPPDGLRPLYTESLQWARTQLRSNSAAPDSTRSSMPSPGRTRQGSLAKSA